MNGKVLTMYLMDGDPIGRIKCKIANWTGIVYKIPRISIDNCDDIQELTQSGVYLLFGTDKDENTVVYIGQAGNRKMAEDCFNAFVNRIIPLIIGAK